MAYGCTLAWLYQQRWSQILEFGSLVDWKWCHYMMVEADIYLRLLLISILDIYTVFEVLFFCLKGILEHPYTITLAKLASCFGLLGHLRVGMMQLRHGWGWYPPQTDSHIHKRHIQHIWAIGMLSRRHMRAHPYTIIQAKLAPDFGIWVTCGLKMMPLRHGWGWHPPLTASHIYKTYKMCLR